MVGWTCGCASGVLLIWFELLLGFLCWLINVSCWLLGWCLFTVSVLMFVILLLLVVVVCGLFACFGLVLILVV